ncbi:MAG TPA: XRE family transcriptional regulator [Terrimesophilobacter sp.]|nr:XRE family transcriptional regulator [Terrimesophilobacter sp.]HRP99416.1 XRE family transcriptional regulator [Terrimesophilobacter sp.]
MDDENGGEWTLVGARIRAAREAKGMSVRELARRIDVSASHVSQVERGLASFSVRALYTVAGVLGISMDSLFEPVDGDAELSSPQALPDGALGSSLDDAGIVQRVGDRPTITLASGPRWERLTARPETMCEFIEVIYQPANAATQSIDFVRHEGREYGIVTRGSLTVQVGFESTVLDEGDSIALDCSTPHRFWNDTAEEVRAIWFVLDRYPDPHEPGSQATTPSSHRDASTVAHTMSGSGFAS